MHKLLEQQLKNHGLTEALEQPVAKLLKEVSDTYTQLEANARNDMLEAMLNAIPGFVSWISSDLHYLGVNKRLAEAFGRSPSDFVGKPVNFLGVGGPFKEFLSAFMASDKIQESGEVIQVDLNKTNEWRWYLLVGQKYEGKQRAVIIGIDITDLKNAESLISEQHRKMAASAKMAALGQMAAGLAHEISNPLTVLMGANQLSLRVLKKSPLDTEKLEKNCSKIEAMGIRITDIIKSCKVFSREGSDDAMTLTPVKALIHDTLELCKGRISETKTELKLNLLQDGLTLLCHSTQISQVMLNLINNSLDEMLHLSERWIEISAKERDDKIEIRVTDSGLGIDPENTEKIFDPFFTTKELGVGTGLGLNICRGIITKHQGNISVDPNVSNTSFVISLPREMQEIESEGK